jgi:Flp pilus assembly pilin Flp
MPMFERMSSLPRSFHLTIRKTSACLGRLRGKRGQTLAEYALVLALISVVAISVLATMGNQVAAVYTTINRQMSVAQVGGGGSAPSHGH